MVTLMLAPRLLGRLGESAARAGSVTRRNLEGSSWVVLLSGFLEPVFYLFSIGVGVGALVGDFELADGRLVGYASFVAPAMLASSAMNGVLTETTYNFYGRLRWQKVFDAIVATPVRPFEIALGELAWALVRGTAYAAAFLALMVGLGLTTVAWAIPALFASLLIGFAFGALGMVISTFIRTWQDFDYTSVVTFAMFIFAGTFVPADTYPGGVQVVVWLTPLFHGVELVRGFTTGVVSWTMLIHALYLVTMTAVCLRIAARRVTRLLCP
jgi:lipooligosaccharide transport system permease protein